MTKLLGKLEPKVDERNLRAARYLPQAPAPPTYDFMRTSGSGNRRGRRRSFPARTFGNTEYGNCTKASQANLLMRLERREQRKTVVLSSEEVIAEYLRMTGGADEGWYELDALKDWREFGFNLESRPDQVYKIEAFTQVETSSIEEVKLAISTFGMIKICFGLPAAWQHVEPEGYPTASGSHVWDVGVGNDYEINSWGGHSLSADAYDEVGIDVIHTWYEAAIQVRQKVTWAAVQRYADEAYTVVDSIDAWRKQPVTAKAADWDRLEKDLKEVTA